MRPRARILPVAACLALASAAFALADPAIPKVPLYIVKDGIRIDHATYKGFLYYGDQCERCHGPEGAGGSFAPDLTDSVRHLSRDKFNSTVLEGRRNMTVAVHNVMPAFKPNPDVVENLDHIYAYLKARSDGLLRRGHPEHLED